ncbi:MAG: DinB family protein [Planctomycetota bacterium]
MDMQRVLHKFETTSGTWRQALARRTDECFSKERADGEWTLGQACDHVTSVSLKFLEGAEALARGEGQPGRTGLMPKIMINLVGSLPPGRFKVPNNLPPEFATFATPNPITKTEAIARFEEVERRHRELLDPVSAASPKTCSKHPAAGWLNAGQWYKLSEMHMRHHLRQLRRIEKDLDS